MTNSELMALADQRLRDGFILIHRSARPANSAGMDIQQDVLEIEEKIRTLLDKLGVK
jgi:hypothetical protein